jgi:hypothetical protein
LQDPALQAPSEPLGVPLARATPPPERPSCDRPVARPAARGERRFLGSASGTARDASRRRHGRLGVDLAGRWAVRRRLGLTDSCTAAAPDEATERTRRGDPDPMRPWRRKVAAAAASETSGTDTRTRRLASGAVRRAWHPHVVRNLDPDARPWGTGPSIIFCVMFGTQRGANNVVRPG